MVAAEAYATDLPFNDNDFNNAYNYAINNNDKNIILYYGKTQVSGNSSVIGYIVCIFDDDVYLRRSNNYLYGYQDIEGNSRLRPNSIRNYHNGGYSTPNPSSTSLLFESASAGGNIYYNGNVYRTSVSSTGNLNLINEIFQPEPTPTPTPTPEPTITPIPTELPFQIPGNEKQLQYLYLTDMNLIRANRFFLAYGFSDDRLDIWQSYYEEASHGFQQGNVTFSGSINGTTYENISLSEASRLIQTASGIEEITGQYGYFINLSDMKYACAVTGVTGSAAPDQWECQPESNGALGDDDIFITIDSAYHSTEATGNPPVYWRVYTVGGDQFQETGSISGTEVGTISETTDAAGNVITEIAWKTTSFLNVEHRSRIYANVLYAPEGLQCLNGLDDFDTGNANFQRASKTFMYQDDNHPVICALIYDGTYNSSIFSGGVLEYTPWKVVNGSKVYTGSIIPTTRISGGGVVHLAEFTDFQNGDIVGCDITILSGFGSIQPLYVGPYSAVPDEIYALINGITAGQAQTDQMIEMIKETAEELTAVNNNAVTTDINTNQSALTQALTSKGYTYPLVQISGLKESLMAVEPVGQIQLPAIFKSGESWILDLTVVENYLGPLWNFGRGLLYIWLALNIMDMLMDLFNYIAQYDQDD